MRKFDFIVGSLLLLVFMMSCTQQFDQKGIKDVIVLQVDNTNICKTKYTVRFSDETQNHDSVYYWAGLKRLNSEGGSNPIVANSVGAFMKPPFFSAELIVELSPAIYFLPGEKLKIIVAKTGNNSDVGNYRQAFGTSASKTLLDAPTFPPSCCPIDIQLTANGITMSNASSNKIVYIDETGPTMPSLSAVVGNSQVSDLVDWTLTITYTRSGRNDIETYNYNSVPAANGWLINSSIGSQIRGGQAILTCHSQDLYCTENFTFCIRARNPAVPTVEDYIDNSLGAIWYAKYVAKHEGGVQNSRRYLQFNEIGSLVCTSSDVKFTPNASGDGGFGMYQLTNIFGRLPNEQELWDWKENVVAGVSWLGVKQNGANIHMLGERAEADSMTMIPNDPNPPDTTLSSVTYGDGSPKTLEHAVAMKRYNGLGIERLDFIYFDEFERIWKFRPWATFRRKNGTLDSNAYVSDVSALYP